jgi:hypothetical protein
MGAWQSIEELMMYESGLVLLGALDDIVFHYGCPRNEITSLDGRCGADLADEVTELISDVEQALGEAREAVADWKRLSAIGRLHPLGGPGLDNKDDGS